MADLLGQKFSILLPQDTKAKIQYGKLSTHLCVLPNDAQLMKSTSPVRSHQSCFSVLLSGLA